MLNENHISGSKAVVFFSSKFVLGIPTNKVCQLISSKWRHDLGSSKLKPHHDRTSTWMCPAILIAAFQLLAEALDLPRVTWEKMGASSQNWGGQIFTSRAHFPLPLVCISQPLPQYIGNWLCLHTCDTHGNINSHHLSQMCKLMCTVYTLICTFDITLYTVPGGKLLVFHQSWFLSAFPTGCLRVSHFHGLCVSRYVSPEQWLPSRNSISAREIINNHELN